GSYMYEGRRDDALREACGGVRVVIAIDFWEQLGRRLLTEVALLDGTTIQHGAVIPVLVPLVKVAVRDDGTIGWDCAALVGEDGTLRWTDDQDHRPAALHEQLLRAHARAHAHATAATTLDAVADALRRAQQLLLASAPERALATLSNVWRQRRDPRLLALAQ